MGRKQRPRLTVPTGPGLNMVYYNRRGGDWVKHLNTRQQWAYIVGCLLFVAAMFVPWRGQSDSSEAAGGRIHAGWSKPAPVAMYVTFGAIIAGTVVALFALRKPPSR